jgi:hypothetical protein
MLAGFSAHLLIPVLPKSDSGEGADCRSHPRATVAKVQTAVATQERQRRRCRLPLPPKSDSAEGADCRCLPKATAPKVQTAAVRYGRVLLIDK